MNRQQENERELVGAWNEDTDQQFFLEERLLKENYQEEYSLMPERDSYYRMMMKGEIKVKSESAMENRRFVSWLRKEYESFSEYLKYCETELTEKELKTLVAEKNQEQLMEDIKVMLEIAGSITLEDFALEGKLTSMIYKAMDESAAFKYLAAEMACIYYCNSISS